MKWNFLKFSRRKVSRHCQLWTLWQSFSELTSELMFLSWKDILVRFPNLQGNTRLKWRVSEVSPEAIGIAKEIKAQTVRCWRLPYSVLGSKPWTAISVFCFVFFILCVVAMHVHVSINLRFLIVKLKFSSLFFILLLWGVQTMLSNIKEITLAHPAHLRWVYVLFF